MAEYNAGSIEALLELNRDPFEAGLATAKSEGQTYADEGITVPIRAQADTAEEEAEIEAMQAVASASPIQLYLTLKDALTPAQEELRHTLLQLQSDVSPIDVLLQVIPDFGSATTAQLALQAELALHPLEDPLVVTPDLESALAAQAYLQEIVGHTLYDPLKAVADDSSVIKAQAEMQALAKPLMLNVDYDADQANWLDAVLHGFQQLQETPEKFKVAIDAEPNLLEALAAIESLQTFADMHSVEVHAMLGIEGGDIDQFFDAMRASLADEVENFGIASTSWARGAMEAIAPELQISLKDAVDWTQQYLDQHFLEDFPDVLKQRVSEATRNLSQYHLTNEELVSRPLNVIPQASTTALRDSLVDALSREPLRIPIGLDLLGLHDAIQKGESAAGTYFTGFTGELQDRLMGWNQTFEEWLDDHPLTDNIHVAADLESLQVARAQIEASGGTIWDLLAVRPDIASEEAALEVLQALARQNNLDIPLEFNSAEALVALEAVKAEIRSIYDIPAPDQIPQVISQLNTLLPLLRTVARAYPSTFGDDVYPAAVLSTSADELVERVRSRAAGLQALVGDVDTSVSHLDADAQRALQTFNIPANEWDNWKPLTLTLQQVKDLLGDTVGSFEEFDEEWRRQQNLPMPTWTERWPALLQEVEKDYIEIADGYHRLSDYIKQGDLNIPVLLKAYIEPAQILEAQAEAQEIVSHTLYDMLVAVADIGSVLEQQAKLQALADTYGLDMPIETYTDPTKLKNALFVTEAAIKAGLKPVDVPVEAAPDIPEAEVAFDTLQAALDSHDPLQIKAALNGVELRNLAASTLYQAVSGLGIPFNEAKTKENLIRALTAGLVGFTGELKVKPEVDTGGIDVNAILENLRGMSESELNDLAVGLKLDPESFAGSETALINEIAQLQVIAAEHAISEQLKVSVDEASVAEAQSVLNGLTRDQLKGVAQRLGVSTSDFGQKAQIASAIENVGVSDERLAQIVAQVVSAMPGRSAGDTSGATGLSADVLQQIAGSGNSDAIMAHIRNLAAQPRWLLDATAELKGVDDPDKLLTKPLVIDAILRATGVTNFMNVGVSQKDLSESIAQAQVALLTLTQRIQHIPVDLTGRQQVLEQITALHAQLQAVGNDDIHVGIDAVDITKVQAEIALIKGELAGLQTESLLAGAAGGGGKAASPLEGAAAGGPTSLLSSLLAGGGGVATGLSAAHLVTVAVPLVVTWLESLAGGILLGAGALGTAAVGFGTDLAGTGQAIGDIQTVLKAQAGLTKAQQDQAAQASQSQSQATAAAGAVGPAQDAYNQALAASNKLQLQYNALRDGGKNNDAAALAVQAQYQTALQKTDAARSALTSATDKASSANQKATQQTTALTDAQVAYQNAINGFNPVARTSVINAANEISNFKSLFDQYTGAAENVGAQIIQQFVKTGEAYLPAIGKFALENTKTIQTGLQPFFSWLDGAGLGIFTQLEQNFQKTLPQGINALEQGFELIAKTIDYVSTNFNGKFIVDLDNFLVKWNGVDFGRWEKEINVLVGDFKVVWDLWKAIFETLGEFLHLEAGTGVAVIKQITNALIDLDNWLKQAFGGDLIHDLFEAHKEQITDLLQAFGILITQVGPPLVQLLTTIAKDAAPLLPLIAQVMAPFLVALTELLNVVLKIPGLGNFLTLLIVMRGLEAIPWFSIGSGMSFFLKPLEWLIAAPFDKLIGSLVKLTLTFGPLGDAIAAFGAKAAISEGETGGFWTNILGAKGTPKGTALARDAEGNLVKAEGTEAAEGAGTVGAAGLASRLGGSAQGIGLGVAAGGVGGYFLGKYTEPQGTGAQASVGRDLTTAGGGLLGLAGGLAATGVGVIPAAFVAAAGAAVLAAGETTSHWTAVRTFLIKAGHDIEVAWGQAFAILKSGWGSVENVATGAGKSIGNWADTAFGRIENVATGTFKSLDNWFAVNPSHWAASLVGAFVNIGGDLEGVGTTIGADFKQWFVTDPSQWISDGISAVAGFGGRAESAIIGGFKDAGKFLQNIGEELVGGLIHGLEHNPVTNWVDNTAHSIVNRFKSIFGIASPAQVTIDMGTELNAGFAQGLESSTGVATKAASTVANNIINAFKPIGGIAIADKNIGGLSSFFHQLAGVFTDINTAVNASAQINPAGIFQMEATLYSLGAVLPKLAEAEEAVNKDWDRLTKAGKDGATGNQGIKGFNALLGSIEYLFNNLQTAARSSNNVSTEGILEIEHSISQLPSLMEWLAGEITTIQYWIDRTPTGVSQSMAGYLGSLDKLFNAVPGAARSGASITVQSLLAIEFAVAQMPSLMMVLAGEITTIQYWINRTPAGISQQMAGYLGSLTRLFQAIQVTGQSSGNVNLQNLMGIEHGIVQLPTLMKLLAGEITTIQYWIERTPAGISQQMVGYLASLTRLFNAIGSTGGSAHSVNVQNLLGIEHGIMQLPSLMKILAGEITTIQYWIVRTPAGVSQQMTRYLTNLVALFNSVQRAGHSSGSVSVGNLLSIEHGIMQLPSLMKVIADEITTLQYWIVRTPTGIAAQMQGYLGSLDKLFNVLPTAARSAQNASTGDILHIEKAVSQLPSLASQLSTDLAQTAHAIGTNKGGAALAASFFTGLDDLFTALKSAGGAAKGTDNAAALAGIHLGTSLGGGVVLGISHSTAGVATAVNNLFVGTKTVVPFLDGEAIGESIGSGIALGISKSSTGVNTSITTLLTGAVTAATQHIVSASPSRLFAESVGRPIAEGIAQGISENGHLVSAALRDITSVPSGLSLRGVIPTGFAPGLASGGGSTEVHYAPTFSTKIVNAAGMTAAQVQAAATKAGKAAAKESHQELLTVIQQHGGVQ